MTFIEVEALIIGAGISGIVTAKCLMDVGITPVVLEMTGELGGLWRYRRHGTGVMSFTYINVSKYNYCFSDFPFPESAAEFPRHDEMLTYIESYVDRNKLATLIKYHRRASRLRRDNDRWILEVEALDELTGKVVATETYKSLFIAVASGHHAQPQLVEFAGQSTFPGCITHSVEYKDVHTNDVANKRCLVVGIGNSAVDAASNMASRGNKSPVHLSTRSGAWIVPNYVAGLPVDLYACRFFLKLPWRIATMIFEIVLLFIVGRPGRLGIEPKMRALQTQPTVSSSFLHHVQRRHIVVHDDVQLIERDRVTFKDGSRIEVDYILTCVGYQISLPFLNEPERKQVLSEADNRLSLYKNVFSPQIGHTLAFVGFVQPASGGIIGMSEIQARWFAELCLGRVTLPPPATMLSEMEMDRSQNDDRFYHSNRHTIQRDPLLYCDEIAAKFGARPNLFEHLSLSWRLLFGSGVAQYRLRGPGSWPGAAAAVRNVPVTPMMSLFGMMLGLVVGSGLLVFFWILWELID